MDLNAVMMWFQTGSNLFYALVIVLGLWIFYEYFIDFILRLPRIMIILGITYIILKTFLGFPL